jgi:hypothetical protein
MNKWHRLALMMAILFLMACGTSTAASTDASPQDSAQTSGKKEGEEGMAYREMPPIQENNTASAASSKNTPITQDDIRMAMLLAESVDGRTYAADMMSAADVAIKKANEATQEADKQVEWKKALTQLQKAYDESLPLFAKAKIEELESLKTLLLSDKVNLYANEEYKLVLSQIESTQEQLQNHNVSQPVMMMFDKTWQNGQGLDKAVAENIRRVSTLGQDLRMAYIESKQKNAELEAVLSQAEKDFEAYNLVGALDGFKQGFTLLAQTEVDEDFMKKMAEVDRMLAKTQTDLTMVDKLFIMDDKGNVVHPKTYDAQGFLQKNPLRTLEAKNSTSHYAAASYQEVQLVPYSISPLTPLGETAGVAADEGALDMSATALYQQAIELWQKGVVARNEGKLDDAMAYFIKAQEYLAAFKKAAVAKIYTVQYRPSARDCLWRIAGFKDIYANPYMWPVLWQRNRRQIEDPDLIYPGQVLLVPPLK